MMVRNARRCLEEVKGGIKIISTRVPKRLHEASRCCEDLAVAGVFALGGVLFKVHARLPRGLRSIAASSWPPCVATGRSQNVFDWDLLGCNERCQRTAYQRREADTHQSQ